MRGSPSSHPVSPLGRPPPAQRATTGTAQYYCQQRSRNDNTTKIQVTILTTTPIINTRLRHQYHPTIIRGDAKNVGAQQMPPRQISYHRLHNDHRGVVNDSHRLTKAAHINANTTTLPSLHPTAKWPQQQTSGNNTLGEREVLPLPRISRGQLPNEGKQ